MTSLPGSRTDALWAITSYFNPLRFQRRFANFKTFRASLHVPLIAVELAYDSDFELQQQDADILIQLRGGAVLWQKERLLNIALAALPQHCRHVAWLDCDILFTSPDWSVKAAALLERAALIQLFQAVHYLGPEWLPGGDTKSHLDFTQPSATSAIASGSPAAEVLGRRSGDRRFGYAPGLAWAARREILERYGFYDLGIVGGGDRATACAAYRCSEELAQRHLMNAAQRAMYFAWAEPFAHAVSEAATFLPTDIFHLWHGDYPLRGVGTRFEGLQRFNFDPAIDIAIGDNGAWRWNSDKPDLHDYVRGFLASRKEDGASAQPAIRE